MSWRKIVLVLISIKCVQGNSLLSTSSDKEKVEENCTLWRKKEDNLKTAMCNRFLKKNDVKDFI